MNSGKAERDKAHREATRKASVMHCRVCGIVPCEPCHWPRHRGLGGGHAGWGDEEWVPLCRRHHDVLDRRHGVSAAADFERELVIRHIERGPYDPEW